MEKENLFNTGKPTLVDFYADWCGPCRSLAPVIEEIKKEYKNEISVIKVNVDENPALASEFGIMSIPTLMVIKDGKVDSKTVGGRSKETILSLLGL